MNPLYGGPYNNNQNYNQIWMAFQGFQQQQMQQMMYQQLYLQYLQFCQFKNLNPNHQNSFTLFYQQNLGIMIPQPQPQYQHQPQPPQPKPKHKTQPPIKDEDNEIYIKDDENLKVIKPKTEKDLYFGNNQNKLNQEIIITFDLITRIDSIEVKVDKNIMLSALIQELFKKINVSYSNLDNFAFFYSGIKLNPHSKENILSKFGPSLEVNIVVIEELN